MIMKNKYFSYSKKVLILTVLIFGSIYLITEESHPFLSCKKNQERVKRDSVFPWKVPDFGSVKDDEQGRQIKLGKKIFVETYKFLGPEATDTAMRYIGNDMDCQNCHFNAGMQQNVFGLVGVYSDYPKFDSREGKVISIEERINGCISRSMNGKPIPENAGVMNALVAYLKWLSTDIPKNAKVAGQGVPMIPLLSRAADTANGRIVYLENCASCHSTDGSGVLNKSANAEVPADSLKGYDFPPVFGSQSFNDGAGLYRLLTATSFIYEKMPLNDARLTVENSYDVAAFINSQPRPQFKNSGKDFPDLKLKPVDSPFPPYPDNFSQSQHKYGPYQKMIIEGETE